MPSAADPVAGQSHARNAEFIDGGTALRRKDRGGDSHLGQEADYFGLFAPTGDGEVDELLEFPAVGGGIGSRHSGTCRRVRVPRPGAPAWRRPSARKDRAADQCRGRPVPHLEAAYAGPGRGTPRAPGASSADVRPVMRSTAAGGTARTMPSAWIASRLSTVSPRRISTPSCSRALLQTGDQGLPASVEIEHAVARGAPELFQSRTSAQPRQIGRICADPHQHGHELANAWGAGAPLNPLPRWIRPPLPRRSTTVAGCEPPAIFRRR